jgi:hypothetical protein
MKAKRLAKRETENPNYGASLSRLIHFLGIQIYEDIRHQQEV